MSKTCRTEQPRYGHVVGKVQQTHQGRADQHDEAAAQQAGVGLVLRAKTRHGPAPTQAWRVGSHRRRSFHRDQAARSAVAPPCALSGAAVGCGGGNCATPGMVITSVGCLIAVGRKRLKLSTASLMLS